MVSSPQPPHTQYGVEHYLLETLPALGPPPRGDEGFARARFFFDAANNPQDAAPQVHVVGTAGKGSLVGALMRLTVGAGVRTGAHLSPHVYDLRERFLCDGQLPSWPEVIASLSTLWPAVECTEARFGRPPSFFELTNALAWTVGRRAAVRLMLTEAGIGGRVDATNAINRDDKLTVILPIGIDHTDILGTDVAAIAAEKAAVILPGSTVVVAAQGHSAAAEVVAAMAAEREATVINVASSDADDVAVATYEVLAQRHGWQPDPDPAHVPLPGRLETVRLGERTVIFDGAHNPLKLRWLRQHLAEGRPGLVVAAVSREKDLEGCAAELAALGDRIICTDFAVSAGDRVIRNAWPAQELADAVTAAGAPVVEVVSGLPAAARRAVEGNESVILVTGSFMMLEPMRTALTSETAQGQT